MQAGSGGTGFDALGATYPHENAQGLGPFAALVNERPPNDPVLLETARLIQAADFHEQLDDHPAAARATTNLPWLPSGDEGRSRDGGACFIRI